MHFTHFEHCSWVRNPKFTHPRPQPRPPRSLQVIPNLVSTRVQGPHTTSEVVKVWFLIQELNREWKFLIWSRNLTRNSAALYRKSQDDDTPKDILIEFFSNQDGGLGHITINPPLGVEVQPPNASESQVNTTCARHTKRNYKTRHTRHETQDISHKTWETCHKKIYIRHIRHKTWDIRRYT